MSITPLPWIVEEQYKDNADGFYQADIVSDNDDVVDSGEYREVCSHIHSPEDAVFIIRAVNTHERLIDVAHALLTIYKANPHGYRIENRNRLERLIEEAQGRLEE